CRVLLASHRLDAWFLRAVARSFPSQIFHAPICSTAAKLQLRHFFGPPAQWRYQLAPSQHLYALAQCDLASPSVRSVAGRASLLFSLLQLVTGTQPFAYHELQTPEFEVALANFPL